MKHKLTSLTRKPKGIILIGVHCQFVPITHISKVSVQHLYVTVDDLERDELVVALRDARDEEERRVPAVHDLGVLVLEEVAHARAAREDELRDVLDDLRLRLLRHRRVPLREAHLPCGARQS